MRGFDKSEIKEILEEYKASVYENKLQRLLEKKLANLKQKDLVDTYKTKQKLTQYAIGKGYTYTQIKEVLTHLL